MHDASDFIASYSRLPSEQLQVLLGCHPASDPKGDGFAVTNAQEDTTVVIPAADPLHIDQPRQPNLDDEGLVSEAQFPDFCAQVNALSCEQATGVSTGFK